MKVTLSCACRGVGPVCTDECERGRVDFDIAVHQIDLAGLGPEQGLTLLGEYEGPQLTFEVDAFVLETRLAMAREILRPYMMPVPGLSSS